MNQCKLTQSADPSAYKNNNMQNDHHKPPCASCNLQSHAQYCYFIHQLCTLTAKQLSSAWSQKVNLTNAFPHYLPPKPAAAGRASVYPNHPPSLVLPVSSYKRNSTSCSLSCLSQTYARWTSVKNWPLAGSFRIPEWHKPLRQQLGEGGCKLMLGAWCFAWQTESGSRYLSCSYNAQLLVVLTWESC